MTTHLPPRRKLLIWSLVALFCVALLLLVALPVRTSTNEISSQTRDRVDDVAMTGAVAVERQVDSVVALTSTYAQILQEPLSKGASKSDPEGEVRRELSEFHRSSEDISYVSVLDPDGTMSSSYPWAEDSIGTTRADRPFHQQALRSTGISVSGVLFARADGEPHIVVVTHPIYRPFTTELLAILTASIDVTTTFQSWVDRLSDSHGVSLSIYDAHGAVIARPDLGNELITSTNSRIVGRDRGKPWTGEETSNGKPALSSYVPIDDYRWTVRATVQSESALGPIQTLRHQIFGTAGVLIATLLLTLWMLRRAFDERARAQQSLTQTEERMREVIETAEQMFIEVDRVGRITAWNRKAEETLGWKCEDVIGKTALEIPGFIPESQRAAVERRLVQLAAIEEGQSWRERIESVVLRKDTGESVHIEMSMWTTTVGGEIHLSALIQDITARKRFEAERENLVKQQNRLVNELRRTDKSKSDFVSTVSHELRTPLTSIVGYLEMLREGFGGDLTDQQGSMLEVVDRNSRRLLALIEDLLTLSRIEAGTFRVEPIDVEIGPLITGVLQALIPSASDSALQLEVDVASNTGTVRGDYDQLERVLMNILTNAIKFTPEGGRVAIKAYRDREVVHIGVSDTGIGIAIEEQSRLFNRFFRSPDAQARAIQGTGLGLTIVKGIVERHGGEVTLQSAYGVGTTVEITLPSTQPADVLT